MKRTIATLLCAVLLVCAVAPMLAVNASAESLHIRKVVSLVYDDSSSMGKEKWGYANYAMQAFCGMLDSEDTLYVTYMDTYDTVGPTKMDLSPSGIAATLESIRKHEDRGGTPFGAVDTAFNKLKTIPAANETTQYWLVVITDGAFNGGRTSAQLDEDFGGYVSQKMPNGTNPQVTFLSIGPLGDDGVASPKQDVDRGIYTYNAQTAAQIVNTMSSMADRISGRTPVTQGVEQVDGKTVRISSDIPLLNITVLSQNTDAVLKSVKHKNGSSIPVSRSAKLAFDNGTVALNGGAFLVGDAQTPLRAGYYDLCFDRDVSLADLDLLYEPALEARMKVVLNGKELADHSKLSGTFRGDTVGLSFKIYEMGSNVEVSPSLLPAGTVFGLRVAENGSVVKQSSGSDMTLPDYRLKDVTTKITAFVSIPGFKPIEYSRSFTPAFRETVYTVVGESVSGTDRWDAESIDSNTKPAVRFSVYADGELMTDPKAVEALSPSVTTSSSGDAGRISYDANGRIVFAPNKAAGTSGDYTVTVICSVKGGTGTAKYNVHAPVYAVVAEKVSGSICKNEFYGNTVSADFYVTKDGRKLGRADVEGLFTASLGKRQNALDLKTEVLADGTVRCTPYLEENPADNIGEQAVNWFTDWQTYLKLPGSDVEITVSIPSDSVTSVIPVVGASFVGYVLPHIVLPIFILLFLAYCILNVIFKPRFARKAMLYVGTIDTRSFQLHLSRKPLYKHNWKVPAWFFLPFTPVKVGGVTISPMRGKRIYCRERVLWKPVDIAPRDYKLRGYETPEELWGVSGGIAIDSVTFEQLTREEKTKDERILETSGAFIPVKARRGNSMTVICYMLLEDE